MRWTDIWNATYADVNLTIIWAMLLTHGGAVLAEGDSNLKVFGLGKSNTKKEHNLEDKASCSFVIAKSRPQPTFSLRRILSSRPRNRRHYPNPQYHQTGNADINRSQPSDAEAPGDAADEQQQPDEIEREGHE